MTSEVFRSKSDVAYAELKRRILGSELEPDAVINQERLAAELSISTTPVREALKRLKAEDLVRLDAHRDARVTQLSADEAQSLYELRQSVDPLAAKLAAERATADDVAAIEHALAKLRPLTVDSALSDFDVHREFHRTIHEASHNHILVNVLDRLWDKADRYRMVGLGALVEADSAAATDDQPDVHAQLADAVVTGDAVRAHSVMFEIVSSSHGRRAVDVLRATEAQAEETTWRSAER